jgi:hypothetical protein
MKTLKFAVFLAATVGLPNAYAQKGTLTFPQPPRTNPPPKDYVVVPPPPPLSTLKDQPRPNSAPGPKTAPGKAVLITAEEARTIIDGFKAAYPKLGSPRLLVYVDRAQLNEAAPPEKIPHPESREGSGTVNPGPSTDNAGDKSPPALADKQLVRDIGQCFSRPLRDAGASLTDPSAAAQVMGERPLDDFIGSSDQPEAQKDREALKKIADAVIEVSIFPMNTTGSAVPASQLTPVPDIQATAISLKDSRILGQASSSDLTSRLAPSTQASFDLREITEATALTLMEDMTPKP